MNAVRVVVGLFTNHLIASVNAVRIVVGTLQVFVLHAHLVLEFAFHRVHRYGTLLYNNGERVIINY